MIDKSEFKFVRFFEGTIKPITSCTNMDTETVLSLMFMMEDLLEDEEKEDLE